ncbi:hypothetical protein KIK84_13715 [Curvibacter sp. CHRR-16]|uniref:hypothetical protein n=1 Tax=Curvibacter sp. CHRR-16 TaxID=2835872 RepID=UPI001BDB4A8D|nr:hypothetical protein [Curvibacter sp. CHRR-16]MBT0571387.1 hypothetical protein [Curvibacter sp. CHRR-16]
MITIPLLIIFALYIALMLWIRKRFDSSLARRAVVLVFASPFIYWIGTYQYMHYRHEQDCAREGGLKVFVQPEKVDRIQLDPKHFNEPTAEWLLNRNYPNLKAVEAWDGTYDGTGTYGRNGHLFTYTLDPATTSLPEKERKFIKTPLTNLTDGLYVISKVPKWSHEISKTTTTLSRNGRLYASATWFYHYWSNNQAMNIGWQCFERVDETQQLTSLILK